MYYNSKEDRVELSVRELCALAFKGGSIDNRGYMPALFRRADEGREVHEKLRRLREQGIGLQPSLRPARRSRGSEETLGGAREVPAAAYHAEVTLHHTCRMEGVTFYVSGRADGVWYDPAGACLVEEIKSVSGN